MKKVSRQKFTTIEEVSIMEWLTLVNSALTIVLTSICGYATWYFKKKINSKSSTGEALRVLLRRELRELFNEANSKGYTTYEELEEFTKLYELYHDKLDGNGTGTKLFKDYQKLKIKEDE